MTNFFKRYYPTVCIRRAEMKAMEKLPDSEKTKMLPTVLLAPWLNSIEFSNTFDVVEKSIGKLPIIVDIDRYFVSDSTLPSRQFFTDISDPETGPAKWMSLVEQHENYIPCIQIAGIAADKILQQIDHAKRLGRGFVFRIELQRGYNVESVIPFLASNVNEDILIMVDYGYNESTNLIELAISSVIEKLYAVSAEFKVVVSGSNFPNAFRQFDDFADTREINSRTIYNNLSRKYGNYKFYYGDWASTKPRRYDGGGSKPLPRIDFPTQGRWIIARSTENAWDFQTAAEKITRLPEWQDRPLVWGTGMIEKTAMGLPGGISTGPASIASRINIHLYRQNNFDGPNSVEPPQGKWIDPI